MIATDQEAGKVLTPRWIARKIVEKVFSTRPPRNGDRILDPGCGMGVFIEEVLRSVEQRGVEVEIVGVEIDRKFLSELKKKFKDLKNVRILEEDFLLLPPQTLGFFDYVVGNPPYVSYDKISPKLRNLYRKNFRTAYGRYDLYFLFFEKSLDLLRSGGVLGYVTTEKFLYTLSARELRKLLSKYRVVEIELLPENSFPNVLAYPAITLLTKDKASLKTTLRLRDGRSVEVKFKSNGSPWIPAKEEGSGPKLSDIALRVSAGVATGCDRVYILPKNSVPSELISYVYPTVSGDELSRFEPGGVIDYRRLKNVILVPYAKNGRLLNEEEAKPIIRYLTPKKGELEKRYAVRVKKKPWYAFHEDPPMQHILRPKILWKDIAKVPAFYVDYEGKIIPRHNVYYLVPKNSEIIWDLLEYLNSDKVKKWLIERSQKASNGYLRLQSHILKKIPLPKHLIVKSRRGV